MNEKRKQNRLFTRDEAAAAGLPFDEPGQRRCPHCGGRVEPLGALVGGRVVWVAGAACACGGAVRAAKVAEEGERRRAEEAVARRVEAAGIPRRFLGARVESDEIARYLAGFPHGDGSGLYLHGGVGAGKTHAAAAAARSLVFEGSSVVMTSARSMLDAIRDGYASGAGSAGASRRFEACDVLVIDDLGKEGASGWATGAVYQVVNARYEAMRPLIVTSQYGFEGLRARLARGGERETADAIVSRLEQACAYVPVPGPDRRRR